MFVRKGKAVPVVDVAECVDDIDMNTLQMIGYEAAEYEFFAL